MRALRQNEAVGVLIDQNTAVAEGTFIQFFGKTASANAAFAKLAARTRASVTTRFCILGRTLNRNTFCAFILQLK